MLIGAMIHGVKSPIGLTRRYSGNQKNSQTKWLQRPFEPGSRKLPDSQGCRNLYPCEIQKELSFIISILHRRRTRPSISCSISSGNTRPVEAFNVNRVGYRMDRRNLESGPRLHQNQSWL